jgi:hypothetical protein
MGNENGKDAAAQLKEGLKDFNTQWSKWLKEVLIDFNTQWSAVAIDFNHRWGHAATAWSSAATAWSWAAVASSFSWSQAAVARNFTWSQAAQQAATEVSTRICLAAVAICTMLVCGIAYMFRIYIVGPHALGAGAVVHIDCPGGIWPYVPVHRCLRALQMEGRY